MLFRRVVVLFGNYSSSFSYNGVSSCAVGGCAVNNSNNFFNSYNGVAAGAVASFSSLVAAAAGEHSSAESDCE